MIILTLYNLWNLIFQALIFRYSSKYIFLSVSDVTDLMFLRSYRISGLEIPYYLARKSADCNLVLLPVDNICKLSLNFDFYNIWQHDGSVILCFSVSSS